MKGSSRNGSKEYGSKENGSKENGSKENGCGTGRVFPQEVERHLFPRPRDPCSDWSAGREGGGGAQENSAPERKKPKKLKTKQIRTFTLKSVKRILHPREDKEEACGFQL